MRQTKRSRDLEERANALDVLWYGWDDEVKKWRLCGFLGRTLNDVEAFLDQQERSAQPVPVSAETPEACKHGTDEYVAAVGDRVIVDANGRFCVHGIVTGFDSSYGKPDAYVVVMAEKVFRDGMRCPEYEGRCWYPMQNGVPTPWGPSRSLTKA